MAISTNPKPTIYRSLYENAGPTSNVFISKLTFWGWQRGSLPDINVIYAHLSRSHAIAMVFVGMLGVQPEVSCCHRKSFLF